jgi:hypothetical protein
VTRSAQPYPSHHRRLTAPAVALALAFSASLPSAAQAADPDPCTTGDFVMCIGTDTSNPITPPDLAAHSPTVVPVGQEGSVGTQQVTGEKLDDFTCRYRGTNYAVGDGEGDFISAADDDQGAYVASNAAAPFFFPSTTRSFAVADVGVQVGLGPDWPQPSSVTVSYPWHTSGRLEVDTEISPLPFVGGASDATASYSLTLVLAQDGLEATDEVVQETLDRGLPGAPQSRDVVADFPAGNPETLTVATPANQVYAAFLRSRTDTEATSEAGASARALADFLQAGHAFTDFQDWHFTLPEGFIIGAC